MKKNEIIEKLKGLRENAYKMSTSEIVKLADELVGGVSNIETEPTSEDFEKEVEKMWAQEERYRDTDYTIAELTKQDYEDCARHFANWQKQQDNNDANHALVEQIKTQQMCYEKGMADMKQQMMKDAVTAKVRTVEDFMGTTTFRCVCDKYKVGDKVKIVIVKE